MLSTKSTKIVHGAEMAYVDEGEGRPVVFLHGNPTSSFIWRGIIPYVSNDHRAIAPDLMGMGDSAKPDMAYTYAEQADFLHTFLDELDLNDAVLVVQDWGSGLGFHYARTRPERIAAVAFMEAMVPPVHPIPSFESLGEFAQMLRAIRTDGVGEDMMLKQNFFIEEFLGKRGTSTLMPEEVLNEYRRPFPTEESRKPLLVWPRQIPIAGDPRDVHEVVKANSEWLVSSTLPKLLFHGEPGALIPPPVAEGLKAQLTNLEAVFLGSAGHFIQEDHPDAIGRGLAEWLERV